jgi:hypothetical protein
MFFISVVAECRITKREGMSFIGELRIAYGINNAVQERRKKSKDKKEREREITRTKNC